MYPAISLYRFSTKKLLLCLITSIFCLFYLPTIASATTGGPDGGGYVFLDSQESSCSTTFTDISNTGEALDEFPYSNDAQEIELPFPFEFYGQTRNSLHISREGLILFGLTSPFEDSLNLPLLASDIAGPAIFPYWDSSPISRYSVVRNIYYQVLGAEPNRQFIIQWHTLDEDNLDNGLLIFQVVFYENSNHFDFVYGDVVSGQADRDAGASATIGIQEGSEGDSFIQYSYNDSALLSSGVAALCFFHDVSLKNSINFPQALPGGPVTYTVKFKNSLPEPLTNIAIVDEFPDGFTVDKITPSGPPIQQTNTQPYRWEIDEIPSNSTITIEIAGTITNDLALLDTTLVSTAYITGSGIVDSRPVTTSVYIPIRPDLSTSMITEPPAIAQGKKLTTTLTLSNTSLQPMLDAEFIISFSENVTYVRGILTDGVIYKSDPDRIEGSIDIGPLSAIEISYIAIAPDYYTVITSTATLVQTQLSTPLRLMTRTAIVPKIARGNFCADFEDGYLPSYIETEIIEDENSIGAVKGRVLLQNVSTYKSNYALHLESTFNGGGYYVSGGTTQAATMLLDMSEVNEEVELSFWHSGYYDYSDSDRDLTNEFIRGINIYMSDDGGQNYAKIDFYHRDIRDVIQDDKIVINLSNTAQTYGLTLSEEFRIKFTSSSGFESYYPAEEASASSGISLDDICITTQPPEIEVRSDTGELISDGSASVSEANNTKFGPSINGNRVGMTFTIANVAELGTDLTLQEIEIEGLHPEDFRVAGQPEKMTLEPGESTDFQIEFSTMITRTREAIVRIFSNDSDERIYNFTVQGHGVSDPTLPAYQAPLPTNLDETSEPMDGGKLYLPIIQR